MKKGIFKWKGKGQSKLETDTVYVGGLYTSQVSGKVMVQVYPYNSETKKKGNFYEPYPYDDFKRDFEPYKKKASVEKLSAEATLKMLLEGLLRGIERAKSDPFVQEKYPRGIGFLERMVKELHNKAKRDPNFRLTERQVNKLNQFLGGSSGVLSSVLRRYIVQHCKGNQCSMVGQNDFRFEYVEPPKPLFHITGTLHIQSSERDDTYRIDKKVERLSEVLATYAVSMEGYTFGETEYSFERGVIKMESFHRNRSDVFDVNRMSSKLTLFVNGRPLPKALGEQAIKYFQRG